MTLLISMVPVVELRGAIPIATAHGVDFSVAIIVAIIGNLIPIPFILVFIRKIFRWMRKVSPRLGRIVSGLEAKAEQKQGRVQKYKFWGLLLLVAIPLPGTGAWTGALVAAMMNMRVRRAFPAIALGVVIAAVIVALATRSAASLLI